jgi:hypothetical protein
MPSPELQVPFHRGPSKRFLCWPGMVLSFSSCHYPPYYHALHDVFEREVKGPEETRILPTMVTPTSRFATSLAWEFWHLRDDVLRVYDFNGLTLNRIISGAQQPVDGTEVIIELPSCRSRYFCGGHFHIPTASDQDIDFATPSTDLPP